MLITVCKIRLQLPAVERNILPSTISTLSGISLSGDEKHRFILKFQKDQIPKQLFKSHDTLSIN